MDVAMHVAALDPKYIRKDDVPSEVVDREKNNYRAEAATTGESPDVIDKIIEGKISKFYEGTCLYEQRFIKDETTTIEQLIASRASKLGENISVIRFARFKVGETGSAIQSSKLEPPEGEDAAGVAVRKPRLPNEGSGSATVKPGGGKQS